MAATMKNWLGPRLDEEMEKTLFRIKKEKETLTENVDSQGAGSQIFLKISFPKGGLVQIIQFLKSKDQISAILSDSYSSIQAVLEPEAILDAEKVRSGGGRITQNTEGGVMGIKDFDIFLEIGDDGGLHIGARIRHLRLIGSEGSRKFGSPAPLEARDSTLKLFKQWAMAAKKLSKFPKSERDIGRSKAQDDLKNIPGETDENSQASSKRIRAQKRPQNRKPDAWKGKSKLSKHDVTIPRDQEKILGRKDSWIHVDTSQQVPAAQLPLKLLQYFSEQAIAKSKEVPGASEAPSLINSALAGPQNVISLSSPKSDSTETGSDVASPKTSVSQPKETARSVDGTQSDDGNISDFSLTPSEWPTSPSQKMQKNQLPPDSSDERVCSPLKNQIQKEKIRATSQPPSKSDASFRGIELEGRSLSPNSKGEATENRSQSFNSQGDRDSIASQTLNVQDLPGQLDDGLEPTSASQKLLSSLIHQASSQVTTVNESPVKPRPASGQTVNGVNSESQPEQSLKVLDYRDISADGETRAQSTTVACSSGEKNDIESEDEMSVELEISVPMSLDQRLGIEKHSTVNTGFNQKPSRVSEIREEKPLSVASSLEAAAENSSSRAQTPAPQFSRPQATFLGVLFDQSQHTRALQSDKPQGLSADEPLSDQIQQSLLGDEKLQLDAKVIDEPNSGYSQEPVYDEEMINRQIQIDIESSTHCRRSPTANFNETFPKQIINTRLTTPMRGMIPRRPSTSANRIRLPIMTPLKRKFKAENENNFNFDSVKRQRNGPMSVQATHYQIDESDGNASDLIRQSLQTAQTDSGEAAVDLSLSRDFLGFESRNPKRKSPSSGLYHFSSNVQPAAVRYFEDPNVYQVFQSTYPQFEAPLDRFVMPCVLLERRANSGNPVHKFLWDDYVGRFSSDFEKWSYGISFDDYYDEFVEEPIYTKRVLDPSTLQEALELDPKTVTFMRNVRSTKQDSMSRSGSERATPNPFLEKLKNLPTSGVETKEAKVRRRKGYDNDRGSRRVIQDSIFPSTGHETTGRWSLESIRTPLHRKSRGFDTVAQKTQTNISTAVPHNSSWAKSIVDRSYSASESSEDSDAVPISEHYKSSTHPWEPKDLVSSKFGSPELSRHSNSSASSTPSAIAPFASKPDRQTGKLKRASGKGNVQVTIAKSSRSSQEFPQLIRPISGSSKDQQQTLLKHQNASLKSSSIPPSGQHPRKATKKPIAQVSAGSGTSTTAVKIGKTFRPPMCSNSKSKPANPQNQQQVSSARLPIERLGHSRLPGSSCKLPVPPRPASLQQQQQPPEQTQPSRLKSLSSSSKAVPAASVAGQTPKNPGSQTETDNPELWWQDRKTPFKDFVNHYSKLKVEKGRLGVVDRETGLLVPPSRSQGGSSRHRIDILSWGNGL